MNEDEKRLAQAAMQAQKVQILAYLGAFVGGVALALGVWYLGNAVSPDDLGLWFWLTILAFPVGAFIGSRVALALMAR